MWRRRANWHDGGSVRGGFMTGHRGYGGDGGGDVSVSSRYSDKEHMHSFRDDVGKGFLPCLVCAQACSESTAAAVLCSAAAFR